jgi:hypothetical protein
LQLQTQYTGCLRCVFIAYRQTEFHLPSPSDSFFFPNAATPQVGPRFLDHTQLDTHTHPVGLLWTSDQLITAVTNNKTHNIHKRQTFMSSAGFEPATQAIKVLQNYALDRTATGSDSDSLVTATNPLLSAGTLRLFILPLYSRQKCILIPSAPVTLYSMLFQQVQLFWRKNTSLLVCN